MSTEGKRAWEGSLTYSKDNLASRARRFLLGLVPTAAPFGVWLLGFMLLFFYAGIKEKMESGL